MKKIGFIGLGDMGVGMVKNLLDAQYTVYGYDLDKKRLERFKQMGGYATASNAEVGLECDIVFIMVLNANQCKDVLFGKDGLTKTMKPKSTVIITATIGVKAATEIAEQLEKYKINLLDSPVSGGSFGAAAGTLTMMPSGKKEVFEAVHKVLNIVGKEITYIGENVGMGQVVKSCMQGLVGCTFAGIFEMLVLGKKSGVNPDVLLKVIGTSTVGSTLLHNFVPHIIDRSFIETGARVRVTNKDVALTLDLAKESGVYMPTTSVASQMLQAGTVKYPEEDNQCCIKIFEDIAGVVVKND